MPIKKVVSKGSIPIKIWTEDIESGAIDQATNLANLPFAYKHIAIMPDVHQGYGMPIGGVLATKGVVIPNAVGVDIGCGMCAVKTNILASELNIDVLKKILSHIRQIVPVGFKKHKELQPIELLPETNDNNWVREYSHSVGVCNRESTNAQLSLGTLGGGNHFIEIQQGTDGFVWIMVHSGSRNLGLKVAKHYNELAVELNNKWKSEVPRHWELAFLPLDSEEGQAYLKEMSYCVEYALANRKLIMDRTTDIFAKTINVNIIFNVIKVTGSFGTKKRFETEPIINIAHNYAAMENHFGQNVLVHRKGATRVRKDEIGIIPGSQGTASYIVQGLGNKESFMSCSHGAGRVLSRKKAKQVLSLEDEVAKLDTQGIIHSIRNVSDLDEASGAYKDIDSVMENQSDLVEIVEKLTPLAVIKG